MVIDAAYAHCLRLARQHYENFPVASRLLPAAMRPHIAAVYAFARIADDFADEGDRAPAARLALLDDWRERLDAALAGAPRDEGLDMGAVFIALGETMRTFAIERELLDDLLSAFRQDVTMHRYETWASLLDYCRRSANPVGRIVLRIARVRDDHADRASDAVCTALQLANFWQDLDIDFRRGRVYVPRELFAPAGADLADVGRRRMTPEWRTALTDASRRTRALFAAGRPVTGAVSGRLKLELRATWLGGVRILDRLEAGGFDVFHRRPTLGWRDAIPLAARVLFLAGGTAAMTRKTSFSFSFLVLPRSKREAITAVYDFCRAVDDSVDLEPDPVKATAALDEWRLELGRVFDGAPPHTPEGLRLQPFVAPFRLPRAQFEALIDGVAMDVRPARFQTFAELEPYCHRVASAVGLICAEIFGYRDPAALEYARDLGVALQLTNILRDVAVDGRQGRLYVPIDDLERFGASEADVMQEIAAAGGGVRSSRVKRVLEHQAARARVFFARSDRLLPREDASGFLAAEIMRAVYGDLLARIEAADYDVFTGVIRVPRPTQARLALNTWWRLGR